MGMKSGLKASNRKLSPHLWIPAPYRVRGRLFAGMTDYSKGLRWEKEALIAPF